MNSKGHENGASSDKKIQYLNLVSKRKNCRMCPNLINPSEYPQFDTEEIGPWSIWQGDLNAKILLIGQDWGDVRYYINFMGRDEDSNPTNRHLVELFSSIGFPIRGPSVPSSNQQLFFTNLVLCLKKGGLVAPLSQDCYNNCGNQFLRPLIDIIRPSAIIALGKAAYDETVKQYHLDKIPFREAVEIESGVRIGKCMRLFPVYHCGAHGWNINRKGNLQFKDWKKIRNYLDSLPDQDCN